MHRGKLNDSNKTGTKIYLLVAAVFLIPALLFLSNSIFASDVNLLLYQQSKEDLVSITVENNSTQNVVIDSVYIELDGQKYERPSKEIIQSYNKRNFNFTVTFPSLHGSYPLIVTVRYLNDGQVLSLRHAGLFNFGEALLSDTTCSIEESVIDGNGDIILNAENPERWRLIVPEEIDNVSALTSMDHTVFHVRSRVAGFRNTYPVFAVSEDVSEGKHRTGICSGRLTVVPAIPSQFNKGRISSSILLALSSLFMLVSLFILKRKDAENHFPVTLAKYSSRMFFIATSYYVLKNLDLWLTFSQKLIDWKIYASFIKVALDNLRGSNFHNFFNYFADIFFIALLLLMFPYFYWLNKKEPLGDDKYVSFLKTLYSLPSIFVKRKIYWNSHCKLGMLTIFVKLFFVPLMVSWSISNLFNSPPLWNLYTLNSFLVDVFILTDTVIFTVGYLIESRFLKSEIKSVEPTFLGWLVCLWCYPPFNVFSFRPFDYPIINISINSPQGLHIAMTCAITLLWGLFAWASVALGFKASNLTNRGIVKSGPYRFARHPAYTAKVLIWVIQGVFFSQFGLGILIGFSLIYALRAWTEERHLSRDAAYLEYKKTVKWWFVPGLL